MTQTNPQTSHEPLVQPPRFLSHGYVWVLTLAVLLVPFFVTIPLKLRKHPVIGPLGDQLHIPLLGAFMLLVYWKGPLRGRLWRSAVAAAVCGALIEVVQSQVGRAALVNDWFLDLVGIGIVVGFVLWRGLGQRRGLALMMALLLTVPWNMRRVPAVIHAQEIAKARFPLLDDFENSDTNILWDDTDAGEFGFGCVEGAPGDTTGTNSVLTITGSPPRTWPGARMVHFPYDWRAYSRVLVRARCVGLDSLQVPFALRVDDSAGRDEDARFVQPFLATTQWRVFAMTLTDRMADNCDHVIELKDMETVYIYLVRPTREMILEVDRVWVE